MKTNKGSIVFLSIVLLFTLQQCASIRPAKSEQAVELISYVNDVTNRRFLLFANGKEFRTVAYNPANQTETYGEWTDDMLYTYVNDVSNRQFRIFRNSSLWKTVAYNPANQTETFARVEKESYESDITDFFSYTNILNTRTFNLYKNGSLWKTTTYSPANQTFGQHGTGRFNTSHTVNSDIYSYINDVTNRRFLLFEDGKEWKTVAYNPENQTENYGEISGPSSFYSYVNDVTNRRFIIYLNGVQRKVYPYHPSTQAESFGNLIIYDLY